jgi:hydrogenase-4 membrane subunit HyfE
MSTSNKIRLAAFVIALVAIITGVWHFLFLGYCNGSNLCLILAIATIAVGFDIVKYMEEYFMAKPNQPKNKRKFIVNTIMKLVVLVAMLTVSSYFSAKDVVIKHAPTFVMEFVTYFSWFVIYSFAQVKLDKYFANKKVA